MRADNPDAFEKAFARLQRLLHQPDVRLERDGVHDHVLVESFIPGREYAVEGVLTHGGVHALRDLRQARPAGRTVLRGDDLRHAVTGVGAGAVGRDPHGHRGGPGDSGCRTVPFTPSVA